MEELEAALKDANNDIILVDVREPEELEATFKLPRAVNIPCKCTRLALMLVPP